MPRWTGKQEIETAQQICAAEEAAFEILSDIDLAKPILEERSRRKEKTKAAAVDRLIKAGRVVFEAYRKDPDLGGSAREAARLLDKANNLRWKLAMSGAYIAKAEAYKRSGNEQDCEELVQVGYAGLLDAAKRFDPTKEIRFSTYARWWVVAKMTRFLDPYPVRVTPAFREKLHRVKKAMHRLDNMGGDWSIQDLAIELYMSIDQVRQILDQPLQKVSMSTPIDVHGMGRKTLLSETIEDEESVDPAEKIHAHALEKKLEASLKKLTRRQQRALRLRYGLEGGSPRTLAQVGEIMEISRERVRQIEQEAIGELQILWSLKEEEEPPPEPVHKISREWILENVEGTMSTREVCDGFYSEGTKADYSRTRKQLEKLVPEHLVKERRGRLLYWRRKEEA